MQSHHPKEVFIIDDCSKDGTWDALVDFRETYSVSFSLFLHRIKNGSKGPAKARNYGISHSSCDLIAFTDSDCITDKYWLYKLTYPLRQSDCSNRLVGTGGSVKTFRRDFIGEFFEVMEFLNPPSNLLYLVTANCCYKKNALKEIGGFNEDFNLAGGEDSELSLRLRNRGYFFKFVPTAVVYHCFSSKLRDLISTFIRYGEGSYLIQKQRIRLDERLGGLKKQ